jgi:hypothetical protein
MDESTNFAELRNLIQTTRNLEEYPNHKKGSGS